MPKVIRLLPLSAVLWASAALGNGSGVVGYSTASTCNGCHSGGAAPTVTLTGPASLGAGTTANYTLTVRGGAGTRAGMNVSVSDTFAKLNPVNAAVGSSFGELYQNAPLAFSGDTATFQFSLTAPPFAGTLKIFAAGNSTNGNGSTSGDRATAAELTVTVAAGSGQNPPLITNAAKATSPVRARTVAVSVSANDDGGEANLSYTWAATGPAPVTFTPNGNNAAKSSTAAFSKDGAYAFTVTVRDGTNKTVTSTVNATVESAYSLLRLTPVSAQVAPRGTLQFSASARDQFDAPLLVQPTFAYSVPTGGGTISATGLFTAQPASGGPFAVIVSAMSKSTSATVGVGQPPPAAADTVPPTVSLVAPMPNTRLEPGVVFEATATDDTGVAEVSFEIEGWVLGKATAPPWRATYAGGATLPGGQQLLQAVAKDLAGNVTRSSSVTLQVPETALPDAGTAARDGGVLDPPEGPSPGCGCGGSQGPVLLALLAGVFAWGRRRGRSQV